MRVSIDGAAPVALTLTAGFPLDGTWSAPLTLGADGSQDIQVVFRVMFNPDGTVKRGPDLVEAAASPLGPIFAESARRALLQCQPYTMLHKETYDQWKDLEPVFSLRDMFR